MQRFVSARKHTYFQADVVKLGGFRLTILEGQLSSDYVVDNVFPSHSAPEV